MMSYSKKKYAGIVSAIFVNVLVLILPIRAATWYVDSSAHGSNNGTSWANAWTSIKSMTGSTVAAGDTVFISGGPSGTTQTYLSKSHDAYPGQWLNVVNGATYKIGQDSAHNGTAIFDGEGGSYWLAQSWQNVIISGDAGDGLRHFKLKDGTTSAAGNGGNWNNTRVTYVDFGKTPVGIDHNPATNIEIDHCYFYILNDVADHCSYAQLSGSSYGTSSFHDNTVYVPRSSTTDGIGADAMQWNGSGYSIYNNNFISYPSSTYVGGQHQDGWQSTGSNASYIMIYGNRFTDFGNYCIYPEPYFAGYTHMRIFNNVCVITHSNNTQAIAVSANSTVHANDIIVANNVADGYAIPYTFRNPVLFPDPSAWTACYFYNNISVNGGTNIIDSNVTQTNNVSLTPSQASTYFASWTANSANNNYQITAAATSLIGKGTNLTSYFTTDINDAARASSGNWDLGPYISGSSSGSSTTAPTNAKIAITTQ